jgi:hypothetical protein
MVTERGGPSMVLMLVCGCALLLALSVVGDHRRVGRPVADQLASVQLADDDGGHALFAANALAPGATLTRCIQVQYTGPGAVADVRLVAAAVAGPLAPSLSVTVSVGTGGSFSSCAGFTGTVFYSGSLSDLAGGTADAPGVPAGWSPDGTGSRTYQVTVNVLPDAAEQQWSTATFRWLLVDAPVVPVTPPTSSAPAPTIPRPTTPAPTTPAPTTPAPTTPRPTTPAPTTPPATTPPATTPPAAAPPARPRPPAGHATPRGGGRTGRGSSAVSHHPATPAAAVAQAIQSVLRDSAVVGVRVVKRSPVPAGFMSILVLFLAGQRYIDRSDPKLALAPMWPVPYLEFEDGQPEGTEPEEER